ncbi:hypothetical protein Ais01nite_18560 [Asanoa ishikariensis]|nr:hypothetical protein Ais01nite_18560 [Asanoa ishikariensis]
MQALAQAPLTVSSPTWWPIADARGENSVRSMPRSAISLSWLPSIDSLSSSSEISGYGGGCPASRQAVWAVGAVV